MFFAGSGTTFREHQISHAHKYTHTRSKTRLISHSSIIIFRFWAPAVFLAPTVRLFFRRKKKKDSGASFQRFYLLPLANCSFPYSSHPLDFLSFLQKIFTAIFLPYSPLAGLKLTTKRTAPLLACSWAADSWLLSKSNNGGSFRMCHFIPGNFSPAEIPPLFSQLANCYFLVGVGFLILLKLFHFFPPPCELLGRAQQLPLDNLKKSKEATSFFLLHTFGPVPTQESYEIWGKFSSPPKN